MTDLSAVGRIVIPYTVSGLTHTLHAYVRNPQLVGGNWLINSRATDANDTDWTDAAEALEYCISYVMDDAAVFGTQVLETLEDNAWIPRASNTYPNANGSGTAIEGSQATFVFRDVTFRKVKIVVMEGITSIPAHATTINTAYTNPWDLMLREFTPAHTISTSPYTWLVGRANQYLNAGSPFVSWTTTYNRKVRRARGLA